MYGLPSLSAGGTAGPEEAEPGSPDSLALDDFPPSKAFHCVLMRCQTC